MDEKVGEGMENSSYAQLLKASLKNSDSPAVSDSSSPSTPRFSVKQVNLDPTPNKPLNKPERPSSPRTSFLDTSQSPSRPLSMVDVTNTVGYATHDAVPMTVFYRNDNSHSDTSKARPTLRELRKGFEEEHEQQLPEELKSTDIVENGEMGSTGIVVRKKPDKKVKNAPKFGWLKGVMLRCLLNIWGVMLYLRLSWVTGQAGIGWSSVIVVLSAVVTMLTTLSMSAVCTNGEVKGGGAYYLISRSLGPEFGGSIGLIFSVANAVAVALYVVGFAETVKDLIKEEHGDIVIGELNVIRIIGIGTVVLLLCVTLIGLEWVVRTQMFLLCILVVSIVDVIIGTFIGPQNEKSYAQGFVGLNFPLFKENFGPDYRDGENFFSVFAVFFPAATGILAGVNISGDLKDAQKAIPKGTLWAILISTIVYVLLGWLAGACVLRDASGVVTVATAALNATVNATAAPRDCCSVTKTCDYGLMNDFQVMEKISAWGPIVTGGIFAATLSSALASLVGAPKTFQALCKDKIFPYIEYFGHGVGPGDEPRRGYILTFLIAGGFIAIGDLNVIAPVISNFFLMSYALINYAVFAASLGKSPGWRPSFKYYNMWVSLLGAMICIVIMFLINWWAALVTIVIIITLYKYVDIKKPEANWGSSVQAYTYIRALRFTYRLNTVEDHVKNFRPQCLVLTGAPSSRPDLVRLVSQITRNVGLMICAQVKVGSFGDTEGTKQDAWLRSINVRAFHTICTAPSLREGVRIMLQTVGLGKLKPNTVVLGYKRDWKNLWKTRRGRGLIEEYVNIVHDAFELNNGVAILRLKGELDLKEWAASDDDDWLPERVPTNDSVPKTDPTLSENFLNVAMPDSESNGKVFNVERSTTPESTEPSDLQARPRKDSVPSDSELLQACIDELRGRANSKDSDWSGSLMEKAESDGEDEGEGESRVSSPEATEFDKEQVLVADGGRDPVEELTQECDKSNEEVAEIGIKECIKVTLNEEPIQDEEDEGNETDEATLLNKPEPTTVEEVTFKEKPKGTIDVWWLWDDGGLTILIPYLLSTHNYWKGCKLRVFTLASSSTLKSRELKMANLMKKFRIDISSVVEVEGINKKPSSKSIQNFMKLPVKEEFKDIRTLERDKKTMRNIRLGELIREHSNDAKLLVLTLPVPKVEMTSPLLYMSWLEVLSAVAPPVLMIRGNQQSVLTFYS